MARYEYEVEWTPDGTEPEPEVSDQSRTRAKLVKSVMRSSVDVANEAQLEAHIRKTSKRAGNWKIRFRKHEGTEAVPPEWANGRSVKLDKDGNEVPQ